MQRSELRVPVAGGELVGWVAGEGPHVLLLHGGPAMSGWYLDPLAEELIPGYRVAWYQQRGIEPSTRSGPHGVDQQVRDVEAVLTHLGWDDAIIVGHSWGGFLVVAAATACADRMRAGMAVDPLGAADPSTWPVFEENLGRAVRPEDRARHAEFVALPDADWTDEDVREYMEMVWPGYYADPSAAPPMPDMLSDNTVHQETWRSIEEIQPRIAEQLADIAVPFAFVHGGRSPLVLAESSASVELMPDAELEVVEGAGHFIWHERPGAVRAALDRLAARTAR